MSIHIVQTKGERGLTPRFIRQGLFFANTIVVTFLLLRPAVVMGEPAPPETARLVAQALAEAIAARNPEAAALLCELPINLDGELATTQSELRSRWRQTLQREDLTGLRLERLELLTLSEAIERHGAPPTRLGEIVDEALVAIIRWNRAQLVVILAQRGGRWAVVAVTD